MGSRGSVAPRAGSRQLRAQPVPHSLLGHSAEAGQAAAIDPLSTAGSHSFKQQQCLGARNERSSDGGGTEGMETSCSCSLLG